MEGTRLRILQRLQKEYSDTVEGLSRAIGLAPATIRRHLDILQRDRLVVFREVRKKTGRPEYSFYLTEMGHEALPKGYDQLLGMVVQEMSTLKEADTRARNGQQILKLVFERLAGGLVNTFRDEFEHQDMGQRVATLTHHLEKRDFYPEMDLADGLLQIQLHNCPFRSVALKNDAVCGFDFNLISSLLERDVRRTNCISDGDSGCTYTVDLVEEDRRQLIHMSPA